MKQTRATYATTLSVDGENDMEVVVSYRVIWGAPATGPTYACGGTPADPDEIHDFKLETVDGKSAPWDLMAGAFADLSDKALADAVEEKLLNDEDHHSRMLEEAHEQRAADFDAVMEARAEDRADDRAVWGMA